MTKHTDIINTLVDEYGINHIDEITRNMSLIEKVRAQVNAEMPSSQINYNIRVTYAEKVIESMRFHNDKVLAKQIFVALRMAKVWRHCNSKSVEKLITIIKKYSGIEALETYDKISSYHMNQIVNVLKKGMTIDQLNKYLEVICWEIMDGPSFSNKTEQYGMHENDWFEFMPIRIQYNHLKYFDTFIKVLKYTCNFSQPMTGRFLKHLSSLSDKCLKYTVTDERNWNNLMKGPNWDYGFRLIEIIKSAKDWQPITKKLRQDRQWEIHFNRIPQDKLIRKMDDITYWGHNKKKFSLLIKGIKDMRLSLDPDQEDLLEHELLALKKLIKWFGHEWRNFVSNYGTDTVHDIGINLPAVSNSPFTSNQVKFLRNNKTKWQDAIRIVRNWKQLLAARIDPLATGGFKKATEHLRKLRYNDIINETQNFAQECSKWNVSQNDFSKWSKKWLKHSEIKQETIPMIDITDGDWRFHRLYRDDPRGLFLGEYTECCQHPDGAAPNAAWHGAINPNGAFVVLEHRDTIKFQSWVWRSGDALIFDNIEGSVKKELRKDAKEQYKKGVQAFKKVLGIKKTLIGTGRSKIKFKHPMHLDYGIPRNTESDAFYVWEV